MLHLRSRLPADFLFGSGRERIGIEPWRAEFFPRHFLASNGN